MDYRRTGILKKCNRLVATVDFRIARDSGAIHKRQSVRVGHFDKDPTSSLECVNTRARARSLPWESLESAGHLVRAVQLNTITSGRFSSSGTTAMTKRLPSREAA